MSNSKSLGYISLGVLTNMPPVERVTSGTIFDDFCGGFVRRGIHVIAGASGQGKSICLMNIALGMASNGLKVAYASLENGPVTDGNRLKSFIPLYKGCTNGFSYVDEITFRDMLLDDKGLHVDDVFKELKNDCIDVLVLDGMETLINNAENLYQTGNKVMDELKKATQETGIPVIMGWQLNRGGIRTKIGDMTMAEIAGSMGVSTYASTLYILQYDIDTKLTNVKCLKSRDTVISYREPVAIRTENSEWKIRTDLNSMHSIMIKESTPDAVKDKERIMEGI